MLEHNCLSKTAHACLYVCLFMDPGRVTHNSAVAATDTLDILAGKSRLLLQLKAMQEWFNSSQDLKYGNGM